MQAWEKGMGDIGMIKGGACLVDLARRGRCRRCSRSQGHQHRHGVYRREGEETVNTRKHMHNMIISGARGVVTQC